MEITLRYRMVAAAAGAAVAVGLLSVMGGTGAGVAPAQAAGAAVTRDAGDGAAQQAAVRYWTADRMAAAARASQPARPAPTARPAAPTAPRPSGDTAGYGLRWSSGGTAAAAVGKVFFTLGATDYVCSGALVGDGHAEVVVTAAHCVNSGPGPADAVRWATHWMFVPGFGNGSAPYGEFAALRFFVAAGWTGQAGGSEQYDVAFVHVAAVTRPGGQRPAPLPPGLPVEFAASQDPAAPTRAYVLGYPAEPPYTGLRLDYCAGPASASRAGLATSCDMTAGDSGGPWLAGAGPRPADGPVVAVSAYKLSASPRVLYGTVLGPQARAAYAQAVSTARRPS